MPLAKKPRLHSSNRSFSSAELGKLASHAAHLVAAQGWDWFFQKRQNNSLHYNFADWNHPATSALRQLIRNGTLVLNSALPWSLQQKDQGMLRGSHPSTKHLYTDLLNDEMLDMVSKGYWMVLPYHSLRHLPHLKLSRWCYSATQPPASHHCRLLLSQNQPSHD